MPEFNFLDAAEISSVRVRDDGYLVADAKIARTGIQLYAGSEVGMADKAVVRVYRPETEVFSRDTLASFAHRPITNDHPSEAVTSDNWRKYAVGQSGDEIARDGSFVRVPLMVADGASIKDIQSGKRELSAGYKCELHRESGITPDGEAYDAIQKNIRANHVAIVDRGRAGSECRIGDSANSHSWGAAPISLNPADERKPDMPDTLRKVLVDALQVETTDAGAQAIDKLLKDRSDLQEKITADAANHAAAIEAKDEEIGKLKADLKTAQDAAPKPADLDKMVADRAALVATAQAVVADLKPEGLTDAEIRRKVVAKKLGDEMAAESVSDAEINGMFKAVTKDAKVIDPVSKALQSQDRATLTNDNGQTAYEKRLKDGWKRPQTA